MTIITDDDAFSAFLIDASFAAITFYSEIDCPDCMKLLPVFESQEKEPGYKRIKFGVVNVDNNPIAEKLISTHKLPFVAVYRNSLLVEGGTVISEAQLKTMLDNLPKAKIIL